MKNSQNEKGSIAIVSLVIVLVSALSIVALLQAGSSKNYFYSSDRNQNLANLVKTHLAGKNSCANSFGLIYNSQKVNLAQAQTGSGQEIELMIPTFDSQETAAGDRKIKLGAQLHSYKKTVQSVSLRNLRKSSVDLVSGNITYGGEVALKITDDSLGVDSDIVAAYLLITANTTQDVLSCTSEEDDQSLCTRMGGQYFSNQNPKCLIASGNVSCQPGEFVAGFNSQGQAICRQLTMRCPAGQLLTSIDAQGNPVCLPGAVASGGGGGGNNNGNGSPGIWVPEDFDPMAVFPMSSSAPARPLCWPEVATGVSCNNIGDACSHYRVVISNSVRANYKCVDAAQNPLGQIVQETSGFYSNCVYGVCTQVNVSPGPTGIPCATIGQLYWGQPAASASGLTLMTASLNLPGEARYSCQSGFIPTMSDNLPANNWRMIDRSACAAMILPANPTANLDAICGVVGSSCNGGDPSSASTGAARIFVDPTKCRNLGDRVTGLMQQICECQP
jgi:hypothetical protein